MLLVFNFDLEERFAALTIVRFVRVVNAEHVLLEMWQLSERLLAEFACVRLFSSVHSQVELERGRVGEGAGADLARVGPLTRVNAHVHGELGSLVEPCSALVTPEWLLVLVFRMSAHVIADVALETFAADIAFVEPFVFVEGQDVSFQSVRPRIGFLAEMALEFSGTGVELHVGLQISAGREFEIAVRTRVGFVPGVGTAVHHQLSASRELLVAKLAFVGSLSSVGPLVQSEALFDGEPPSTVLTFVRHLPGVRSHVDGQAANLDELPSADAAFIRFVACVLPRVLLRVVLAGESLVAVRTVEASLFFSSLLVLDNGHGYDGLRALIDLDLRVRLGVLDHDGLSGLLYFPPLGCNFGFCRRRLFGQSCWRWGRFDWTARAGSSCPLVGHLPLPLSLFFKQEVCLLLSCLLLDKRVQRPKKQEIITIVTFVEII